MRLFHPFSLIRRCAFLAALLVLAGLASPAWAGSVVTIAKSNGQFQLLLNGKPFYICGVGGSNFLDQLRGNGGNSIRTWGIDALAKDADGKPLIDRAQELGLMVTAGIWVQHERHGFDYSDEKQLADQREKVRAAVRQYKDNPAILIWGLGNEMEEGNKGDVTRVWKEINVLAGIIKEEDPNHPVMTVIAGAAETKVKAMLQYCPNVDILGVNAYAAAGGAGAGVTKAGWDRPFVLTEFGPVGHWEVPKTTWGAPLESTANQKAASYYATQNVVVTDSKNICLGTYAFVWGNKQETTATWYGMFLPNGEKLPQVDAMAFAWTGKWPENRCPKIGKVDFALAEKTGAPGQTLTVTATVTDPNHDPIRYEWLVIEEAARTGQGGEHEDAPPAHPECTTAQKDNTATIVTPAKPGKYRLFLTVHDGKGGASTANYPFQIQ